MFYNYLKVALRNLVRRKVYSLICISGLALGLGCCILLLLWVQHEMSYDTFHDRARSLYRVEQDQSSPEGTFHVSVGPYPMGAALHAELPEVRAVTRLARAEGLLVRYGDKALFEDRVAAVDTTFLQMFTFPLLSGDPATALSRKHSAVLSEETSARYFGTGNPLGKTLTINNACAFTVTGVVRNAPDNSSLRFDILIPIEFMRDLGLYRDTWSSNNIVTFVELHDRADAGVVGQKVTALVARHGLETAATSSNPDRLRQYWARPPQFSLMPLTDIRLYAVFGFGQRVGTIENVIIFSVLGLFVLVIACMNFMNLSTARTATRSKEIGLRRVIGASRASIALQFLGEALLSACVALGFALVIVTLVLPGLNDLTGKHLTIGQLLDPVAVLGLFGLTLFTGMVSGSYPALVLSRFQPVAVLRGMPGTEPNKALFRKVLVILQFSLSLVLLIGAIVIAQQVEFMRNRHPGYSREHLVYIPLRADTRQHYPSLKQELLRDPQIAGVTGTRQAPTATSSNGWGVAWEGKDPDRRVLFSFTVVDFDYTETMRIGLVTGRSFSKDFGSDTSGAFMVNEEAVRVMGVTSPVGLRFSFGGIDGRIIGVTRNFHYQQLQNAIEPLAIVVSPAAVNFAVVRLREGDIPAALSSLKSAWLRVFPSYPFEYRFFDDDFAEMFARDEQVGAILRFATLLAILIACLGLFGLASFTAEQRTKEIGIRKVLGASVAGITFGLSREFLRWVLFANALSWPIAYYLLTVILQNYAYRTPIHWWVFLLAGATSVAIALATVSWQSLRAARANPVESLRYE